MIKLNVKWILNRKDFDFVKVLGRDDYVGLIDGYLNKFTLLCLDKREALWTFMPEKRANFFGSHCSVGEYVFLQERDSKGDFWHAISIKTGESKTVKNLGDETYFRFGLDGYAAFDVDGKPIVIDPAQAKPIELRGKSLDFSLGFGSNGNYCGFREFPEKNQEIRFVGVMKIDCEVAYFDEKMKLEEDSAKGRLSYSTHNEDQVVFGYYKYRTQKSHFCVFDWNGKLIREIDLSPYLSEGDRTQQGMTADSGKFVFHVRNSEKGIDKFIGVDLNSSGDPWLYEMDMGYSIDMDEIVHAGRYIVSPIGKGGLKKDFLANGQATPTDDCVTRVLDIHTGEVSIIHDDIGGYVVGTDEGLYYTPYGDHATLCYGEFV